MSDSPHAVISPESISAKPHPLSSSPPIPGSPHPPTATLSTLHPSPPPEVEQTLSKLTSHANVTGCLVLSRPEALIIRSGGKDFDPSGPGARDRAEKMRKVTRMVRNLVQGLTKEIEDLEEGDDLGFLRIRTKKYEMMISPSDKYLLVVLQDPTVAP